MIEHLKDNEVFVFGSNAQGFHGAGAAGYACRGDARNTWRQDPWFLAAMKSQKGSQERVGRWAVYGVARGWQQGKEGMSYAVQTIERPGQRKSTPRRTIYYQLLELVQHAHANPAWTYLIAPLGEGYSGWTRDEMKEVWDYLKKVVGRLPSNFTFVGREQGRNVT